MASVCLHCHRPQSRPYRIPIETASKEEEFSFHNLRIEHGGLGVKRDTPFKEL